MGAAAPVGTLVSEARAPGPDSPGSGAPDADALLEVAVEAARMAGELLLGRVRHGAERHVSAKSTPTDLVSEADLASQRAIRELLCSRRPDDGFVGEEEGLSEQGKSGLSWVVDPLDGTVNFLFGIPHWSVSVAVRDGAGTVAGAVFDPNRDELFTASRDGSPALVGSAGALEPAGREGADLESAMVATGLAYDAEVRRAQGKVLARLAPHVRDIRRFGSAALDLTWTAAGRYDAYFERSVKQWDIAAGALICERAGLRVLELPVHEQLPWGILVAPPELAEPLLELVGGP